ncbi:MAG: type II toxin-antitoxin system HicA family toxin [Gammaproteobacteria bacterium]
MTKQRKLVLRILQGDSDNDFNFNEIRNLLIQMGFQERIKGSHHIFRKPGVSDMINLQRAGKHVKPYQVRQIRYTLVKHGLIGIS